MLERICFTGLLAAGLLLAACDETPLEPTDAAARVPPVTISTAPDPTYAVASTGKTYEVNGQVREYAFLASFDLILQGNPEYDIGFTFESDSISLQQLLSSPPDGPGGGVDRERYEFESRADVDRIEPGGRTSRTFDVWYTLPAGGREALIAVTLNFKDDDGIAVNPVHQVRVQP